MARVTVEAAFVRKSLDDLLMKVTSAIAWAKKKEKGGKGIILEIPEPYNHLLDVKPYIRESCFVPPIPEECGDIGVLMGVLRAMPKPRKKPSKVSDQPKARR